MGGVAAESCPTSIELDCACTLPAFWPGWTWLPGVISMQVSPSRVFWRRIAFASEEIGAY